jgi:hypothetical protein
MPMNSYPGKYHYRRPCVADQIAHPIGPSKVLPVQSSPYVDRLAFPAGQSGTASGLPCGTPIVANTTEQFRYSYSESTVAHYAPIYHTPQQHYIPPPTYLNHRAPYDHRPINIIDWSRQEGRNSND